MSDKDQADQDPSIEEILSSIRQIIADDDEEEQQEEVAAAEPEEEVAEEPEAATEPAEKVEEEVAPAEEEAEDILELTPEMAEEPVVEHSMDDDFDIGMDDAEEDVIEEPESEPEPEEIDSLDVADVSEGIISEPVASATIGSLAKLTGNMPVNRSEGYHGVTVEDIVRELLNPMLREWVDGNLPSLVERLVQKELEKLARRASDD